MQTNETRERLSMYSFIEIAFAPFHSRKAPEVAYKENAHKDAKYKSNPLPHQRKLQEAGRTLTQ